MTESAKQAWGEVGDKFSSWGRQVADRYREAGSAAGEASADEAERELTRADEGGVRRAVQRVCRPWARRSRTSEARQELSDAVSAIGDAITATVSEATEAIRSKGGATPPPPPPPPPSGE